MEELDSGSASGATSKKSSKKSSKHHHSQTPSKTKVRGHHSSVTLPPSIAERPKSPLLVHSNTSKHSSRVSERYSGLWEFYYDQYRDDVTVVESEGGDGGRGEGQGSRLKNIRGFLLKRRKSPLKGWHKRYFVLEQGTLYFSRSQTQMMKGKVLGSIDLGLSFIHTDAATRRIDIDGEHQVMHLKTKNPGHFTAWSSCLLSHEMYRKTQLAAGTAPEGHTHLGKGGVASTVTLGDGESLDSWAVRTQTVISGVRKDLDVIRENLETMSVYVRSPAQTSQSALSSTTGALPISHTSSASDLKLPENGSDNQSMQSVTSSATSGETGRGSGGGGSDGTKGDSASGGKIKKKFRKGKQDKKTKESSSNLSPEQVGSGGSASQLMADESIFSMTDSCAIRDDFTATAKIIYAQFCELLDKLDKVGSGLDQVVHQANSTHHQQEMIIHNHQLLLRQSLLQSNELRDRLSQIQQLASGVDTPGTLRVGTPGLAPSRRTPSQSFHGANITRFDSYMSLQSSLSEKFFDALDDLRERSSESEEEEEEVLNTEEEEESPEEESDSELYTSLSHEVLSVINLPPTPKQSTPSMYTLKAASEDVMVDEKLEVRQRRTRLPASMQDMGDFSLWGILRKNIGKDLSKVSMPVTLNEPLSALQRLCEDLEYSELLDEAASHTNVYDRMVKVAAFAVSSFALNYHRAGRKPFNPILGETYECVREDKGFKFIAEQVSHHPPIAACHCTSPNFNFWQDARIKSKFWGKSMEVFPIGITNVTLPKHGDHYQWQKVTSCIHNLLGGQRWVDLYGEMIINNKDKCTCKLTFVKASYWSSKKYVVHGDVYDADGVKVRHLFGTWHEALFCGEDPDSAHCIWRTAPMPTDYEKYFSFGQFAIEMNELEEGLRDQLPRTDCRFRPDQRLLEEGFVQDAEVEKHRVEQIQREARAERERLGQEWKPNFFELRENESSQESWVYKGNYWEHRESSFCDIDLPKLW